MGSRANPEICKFETKCTEKAQGVSSEGGFHNSHPVLWMHPPSGEGYFFYALEPSDRKRRTQWLVTSTGNLVTALNGNSPRSPLPQLHKESSERIASD